jgi:hypothetical protein
VVRSVSQTSVFRCSIAAAAMVPASANITISQWPVLPRTSRLSQRSSTQPNRSMCVVTRPPVNGRASWLAHSWRKVSLPIDREPTSSCNRGLARSP